MYLFSARWNSKVGTKHHNFWDLLEKIWESFEDTSLQIGRLDADPPIRITRPPKVKNVINQAKLRAAEQELLRGGSVMDFLCTARHTFVMVNQKYFNLLITTIEEDNEIGGEIQLDEDDDAPAEVGHDILQLKTSFQSKLPINEIFTINCKLNI